MKNPSFHNIALRLLSLLALALLSPINAKDHDKNTPMLRIICVTTLPGHEDYVFASMGEDDVFNEHKTVPLRSSLITEWLEMPHGELHICVREEGKLISKGNFNYPENSRRALLALLPGADKDEFKPVLIDIAELEFEKGEIMVVNSSEKSAEVMLGENRVEVEPGDHSVQEPTLDESEMFRSLVTYTDDAGETVTCSDRYVRSNKSSRDFVFLLTDARTGIRTLTMSDFGSYE